MKGKKHTPQQIIRKLRGGEADLPPALASFVDSLAR